MVNITQKQADEVIEYFNERARERKILLDGMLLFGPIGESVDAMFWTIREETPVNLELIIKYHLNIPEESSYTTFNDGGPLISVPLVRRIRRTLDNWLRGVRVIEPVEFRVNEGQLFQANLSDKVESVETACYGTDEFIDQYRNEIQQLKGKDFREAIDLGFRIYDEGSNK